MGARLTIRNLDEAVKQRLRIRAARNGRSMEAEIRAILTEAVMEKDLVEPPQLGAKVESVCDSVRGIWEGRISTDEVMKLTRGD